MLRRTVTWLRTISKNVTPFEGRSPNDFFAHALGSPLPEHVEGSGWWLRQAQPPRRIRANKKFP